MNHLVKVEVVITGVASKEMTSEDLWKLSDAAEEAAEEALGLYIELLDDRKVEVKVNGWSVSDTVGHSMERRS